MVPYSTGTNIHLSKEWHGNSSTFSVHASHASSKKSPVETACDWGSGNKLASSSCKTCLAIISLQNDSVHYMCHQDLNACGLQIPENSTFPLSLCFRNGHTELPKWSYTMAAWKDCEENTEIFLGCVCTKRDEENIFKSKENSLHLCNTSTYQ